MLTGCETEEQSEWSGLIREEYSKSLKLLLLHSEARGERESGNEDEGTNWQVGGTSRYPGCKGEQLASQHNSHLLPAYFSRLTSCWLQPFGKSSYSSLCLFLSSLCSPNISSFLPKKNHELNKEGANGNKHPRPCRNAPSELLSAHFGSSSRPDFQVAHQT